MAPSAVIVGAPGSGKSTVGAETARRLQLDFRDTDTDIEQSEGRSIADQFVEDGEEAFRARERAAVADALASHAGIVSLGGGAVLAAETRALLKDQRVIWLRVSASEAAGRVGLGVSRPVLMGNVRGRLVTLLAERTPFYEEVATCTVDTDGRSVDDITDEVIRYLESESTP